MEQLRTATFPENFLFGVADADLQVIGEEHTLKEEGSEPTMWTQFAKTSDVVFEHQTPLPGIDRFHRWKEDIAIMKKLGTRHYRTSVSMSRFLHKDGSVNEKAVAWYRTYFEALKKEGFTLYVTLYHWELPEHLSALGGWKNRIVVDWLVKHALAVHEHLNAYIDEYFILNEPFQFTVSSYHLGEHAPGERDLRGGLLTVHHAMLAQGKVFAALKEKDAKVKLGTVYNPTVTYAATLDQKDVYAARLAWDYQTGVFTEPLYHGRYPEAFAKEFAACMPTPEKGDMEAMKVGHGLSSFGVNFYRGKVIAAEPSAELKFKEVRYPQGIVNGLGWPVSIPPTYPDAFTDLLQELYHRYEAAGMKKIYISENGTCWDDKISPDGGVHDPFRIFYLREHLRQVQQAMLGGVPIAGYFLWTLMDNYEWDLGYKPGSNFGIVHIDRSTLDRTPKDSFVWYGKVLSERKLS